METGRHEEEVDEEEEEDDEEEEEEEEDAGQEGKEEMRCAVIGKMGVGSASGSYGAGPDSSSSTMACS